MDLELLGCNPHDADLQPHVMNNQRTSREVTAQSTEESDEQRVEIKQHNDSTSTNGEASLTVADKHRTAQKAGNVATKQLREASVEGPSTSRRNGNPVKVQEHQGTSEPMESRELNDLRVIPGYLPYPFNQKR